MQLGTLARQAAATFDGIHGGDAVRAAIMPLWMIYETYLQQSGALPAALEEVPEAFIHHCEERGMPDDELHLMLAGMRMILSRSGWKPARFAGLTAPRRRLRIANSATGEYRFVLVPRDRTDPPPV
jgi:hypothetical protein